jgi:hypothetical protein
MELRSGDDPPGGTGAARAAQRLWQCVCGKSYRVSGLDRHRIYWPEGAPADDPVLDGLCIRCGRPLPGKHVHRPDEQRT